MFKTYQLKNALQRGGALLGVAGLLAGIAVTTVPASVFADALNPLTERSLKLSSSSPGWSYKDGSGNETYAPPHSGANGQKTGNEFSFRMSSASATIKGITFQYCTTPAGDCIAPGDNTTKASDYNGTTVKTTKAGAGTITVTDESDEVTGVGTSFVTELNVGATIVTAGGAVHKVAAIDSPTSLTLTEEATVTESGVAFTFRKADTDSTSDLNIVEDDSSMIASADWTSILASNNKTPARDGSQGNFVLLHANASTSMASPLPLWSNYTYATDDGWEMTSTNGETGTIQAGSATNKNNLITITSADGQALSGSLDSNGHGDYFKVIFFGTDDNYITNPGSGSFFVRMNTYNTDNPANFSDATLVDGGVTVANVMNESISIRTKVLETMQFSVGTHDPNLYNTSALGVAGMSAHGQCSTLLMKDPTSGSYSNDPNNVIKMGDTNAENSLETGKAHSAQSYWRLSSNSSGGATVYYTGHTLTNTVGDEITPLTSTATASNPGTEQFGLAIAHGSDTSITAIGNAEAYPVWLDPAKAETYGNAATEGTFAYYLNNGGSPRPDEHSHLPRLFPLQPLAPYNEGAGDITTTTPKFAFNANADTYAIPLASDNTRVVNCVTAKMRYIANIAATTPAGIYTTKINYVASPQY